MNDDVRPYTMEEVDHLCRNKDTLPADPIRLRATVEALEKAQEEAANWHSAFQQKAYPAESCRKERDDGNGGCGACAICCHEATQRAEKAEAERDELRRLQQVWLMSPEAAQRLNGYRQLAEKCATLEAERDAARADVARLREALGNLIDAAQKAWAKHVTKPEGWP